MANQVALAGLSYPALLSPSAVRSMKGNVHQNRSTAVYIPEADFPSLEFVVYMEDISYLISQPSAAIIILMKHRVHQHSNNGQFFILLAHDPPFIIGLSHHDNPHP